MGVGGAGVVLAEMAVAVVVAVVVVCGTSTVCRESRTINWKVHLGNLAILVNPGQKQDCLQSFNLGPSCDLGHLAPLARRLVHLVDQGCQNADNLAPPPTQVGQAGKSGNWGKIAWQTCSNNCSGCPAHCTSSRSRRRSSSSGSSSK